MPPTPLPFVETNAERFLTEALAKYQTDTGITLAPGDPRRILINVMSAIHAQRMAQVNEAANQNLAFYSTDEALDQLSALTGTVRAGATSATVTIRFSAAAPVVGDLGIPQNTRTTADNEVLFATDTESFIPDGLTFVDVASTAEVAGVAGNDFAAGQINILVDPIAGVSSVANTGTSTGGSEIESDDSLRARRLTEIDKFAAGATYDYYATKARLASSQVADVAALSNTPGLVELTILGAGGSIPSVELLSTVSMFINARTVRALTDQVLVVPPTVVSFPVDLHYVAETGYETEIAALDARVAAAVAAFEIWQEGALGRDLQPDRLLADLMAVEGVKRINSTGFAFSIVAETGVAQKTTETITRDGFEGP